jgi:hypothetical protein
VGRGVHHRIARPVLHHASAKEHENAIRQVAGGGKVVRDEEDGEAAFSLERGEKVEQSHADRDVEHGGGLVRDEEIRVGGQRAGDGDPLPLSSGKFIGVAVDEILGRLQTDHSKKFDRPGPRVVDCAPPVAQERAYQVVRDVVHRTQGSERILEDHLDPATIAERGPSGLPREDILPVQQDLSTVGSLQAQHKTSDGALAASRLPHQGHRLAPIDPEGDILRGYHPTARGEKPPGSEGLTKTAHLEERAAWRFGLTYHLTSPSRKKYFV